MDAITDSRKLADAREDYTRGGLVEADLLEDPYAMFSRWYDDAAAAGIYEPNSMVVATASADGAPSARFVLLKGISSDGFVFFTNLDSAKGRDLAENPRCSLLFPWHPLERQVRVEGAVSLLPRSDVDAYFASRPRRSRVGAWASRQSRVVASRDELDAAAAAIEERFPDEVPVPDFWGGYLVAASKLEFWQGRPGRMHDRLVYERTGEGWSTYRLAP
ncbi:pyridoxamine 5'-phosphate oxidase [Nocardioides sp.]|uniref:pyridoxamine 5'-phosphate oxidase n=1 Tax=Nocardioides sp. TaxID=35761 RepID=UPI003D134432